jgi:pimeloyl-ACP methyl ester carboxylesterase
MDMVLTAGLWLRATVWDKTSAKLTGLGHNPKSVRLPGIDGVSSPLGTGLDAQLEAVLAAIDAADQPLVVGHSAASALAWMAADRRVGQVAGVAMIGGYPPADGQPYLEGFDADDDGRIPFPGWEPFAGPDSDDLDEAAKAKLADSAVAVDPLVAKASVSLTNPDRAEVPAAIVCPEFGPEDVQNWMLAGQLPELGRIANVTLLDIETGHWPMVSDPGQLAAALDRYAAELSR